MMRADALKNNATDGCDIRRVALNSLRDQMGIVRQKTMLFAATIRENISFGSPGAGEEQIVAAVRAAQRPAHP